MEQSPKQIITIEPPLDSEAMRFFLQRMKKSPEDLTLVLGDVEAFVTDNREAIACVLVEGMETSIRVMIGAQQEDEEITNAATRLDSAIGDRGWSVDVMDCVTTDIEDLRRLSDQLPTADDEANALTDDERSAYMAENDKDITDEDRKTDALHAIQDRFDH